jgi:hypothetical protein
MNLGSGICDLWSPAVVRTLACAMVPGIPQAEICPQAASGAQSLARAA